MPSNASSPSPAAAAPHARELADVAVVHERVAAAAERVAVRLALAAVLRRRAHVGEDHRALHDARQLEQVVLFHAGVTERNSAGSGCHLGRVPGDAEAVAVQRFLLALAVEALRDDRVLGSTTSDDRRMVGPRYSVKRHMAPDSSAAYARNVGWYELRVPRRPLARAMSRTATNEPLRAGRRRHAAPMQFAPLRLGKVEIGMPAVQAALSGYSDLAMRTSRASTARPTR
jgi:hypothetical protein